MNNKELTDKIKNMPKDKFEETFSTALSVVFVLECVLVFGLYFILRGCGLFLAADTYLALLLILSMRRSLNNIAPEIKQELEKRLADKSLDKETQNATKEDCAIDVEAKEESTSAN